ncbi:unnamed protein product [Durusdinium trenchii]|uniref:Peptide-O-fucosyltransferase n=1 Tax=Durusdinium trenchii TaxID=1381693 RepID=A0ABP0NT30_9DINO
MHGIYCWAQSLLTWCAATQDFGALLEAEDADVGILQPLTSHESSVDWPLGDLDGASLRLRFRTPLVDLNRQVVLTLAEKDQIILRVLWAWQEDSAVQRREETVVILGKNWLAPGSFCKLELHISLQDTYLKINEFNLGSLQLPISKNSSLQLHVGKAVKAADVDFLGHLFEVATWRGHAPVRRAWRPHSCPNLQVSLWLNLRARAMQVLQCAFSPACTLKSAPGRYLLTMADEILDRDLGDLSEVKNQCPVGFALAHAVSLFFGYLMEGDPMQTYGSVKFAARLLNLNETSKEHIFGGTRPLLWLRLLGALSRRRIVDLLNMPSISGPTSLRGAFWISAGGNHSVSHLHVKEVEAGVASRLCFEIRHESDHLALLRNSVETLATAGLFARGGKLVVRLRGCAGAWSDPGAPQGWYLWWLQRRFGSSALVLCDMKAHGCEGLTVLLHSSWHLLPFRSEHVWRKLREAAELLNGGPEIFAVSLMEKSMQGLSALGRGGSALQRHSDWKTFVLAAPALSRDWNFKEAARTLTDIYNLFAETGANSTYWSVQEMVEAVQWCAHPQPPFPRYPCAPRSWWTKELPGGSESEEDVWLLRSPNSGSGDRIALSSGLFQKTDGTSYDHSTSAKSALGIPPCYACHQAELNSKPFTLYISVLDVLGPCRELFSNLVLDTLEALQFASFQGPEVVLVEPFISNAVWRQFGEGDAELLHKAKPNASIYKFWNEAGACGLRFGSVTPFGDLFDWRHLTQWLMEVRGIRGQISWEQFLRETGGQIDVLAMQAPHVDDGKSLPCADSKEEATLRFYQTELRVRRRVCVRSTKHTQGFELRFLDDGRLAEVVQSAVAQAKSERKTWTAVGLYLYWVEGAERARLHPGRYGLLSSHTFYTSIWTGLRFAPAILRRAAVVAQQMGLLLRTRTQSRAGAFLAVHWRKGDWFLGPHPRKLEQAQLAEPGAFALRLKSFLQETKLQRLFLMSNAAPGSEAVAKLRDELNGTAELLQAPFLPGQENNLRQLCVEMAIASAADFFVAFGDGLIQGHVSMPSLLVLQMRTHAESWPIDSNAFSFASPELFGSDWLGL